MQNYIILIEYLYIQNQTGIHLLLFATSIQIQKLNCSLKGIRIWVHNSAVLQPLSDTSQFYKKSPQGIVAAVHFDSLFRLLIYYQHHKL